MGNANTCVFLARRSPDILENVNIIWFGTRYRQYSKYYKPGWPPPQDIGWNTGPLWSAYRVYRAGPTSAVSTTTATTPIGGGLWRVANEEQAHESRPCPCNGSSSRLREWLRQRQSESPCRSNCPATPALLCADPGEQSQRSIGACGAEVSVSSTCPGRHPHASTSYLAAGPQRLNGRSKR